MEYRVYGNDIAVRLETGEEINASLLAVAEREGVTLAAFTGLGASDHLSLGVFNLETHDYDRAEYTGNHEITSLTGNLSTMNGRSYIHSHITCAADAANVVGGHLFAATISLTAEIFIHVLAGSCLAEAAADPDKIAADKIEAAAGQSKATAGGVGTGQCNAAAGGVRALDDKLGINLLHFEG